MRISTDNYFAQLEYQVAHILAGHLVEHSDIPLTDITGLAAILTGSDYDDELVANLMPQVCTIVADERAEAERMKARKAELHKAPKK